MNSRAARGTLAALLVAATIACAFVAFTLATGVPAMRHDWAIPTSCEGWSAFASTLTSGWSPNGIGSARPYPTLYVLGPALALGGCSVGALPTLALLLLVIAGCFLYAGVSIARPRPGAPWFGLSLGTLLLFSPWVYEKLVAGHLTMLLSAAMCAILAGELLRARPRDWCVFGASFIAAFQIQFGLLALLLSLFITFRLRPLILVFAGVMLSLTPSAIGILFSASTLYAIPYTLSWQLANSVRAVDAILLAGYAPDYGAGSRLLFNIGSGILVGYTILGCALGIWQPRTRPLGARIAVLALFLILFATGLKGLFSAVYAASLAWRPILVFRELYDLIGLVSICYIVLSSLAGELPRIVRVGTWAGAAIFMIAWAHSPPSAWWVNGAAVPHVPIDTLPRNSRFALFPSRQPMSLGRQGAGVDPDDYARRENVTPVNDYSESYPETAALAEYETSGSASDLEALSVGATIMRPYLKTDTRLLGEAVPYPERAIVRRPSATLKPEPEMALVGVPYTSDVPRPIHEVYLFNNGEPLTEQPTLVPVSPNLATADARRGWVSASLLLSRVPEIANGIGGVFTESSVAKLVVPAETTRALVWIKGRLSSQHSRLSGSTNGFSWIKARPSSLLSCAGRCAVIAWEKDRLVPLKAAPSREARVPGTAVDFKAISPFLLFGDLGASRQNDMLLFRSRFDPHWFLIGLPAYRHVQVSLAFNGFILPPHRATSFLLIQGTALAQFIAMIVAFVAFLITMFRLRTIPGQERSQLQPGETPG